MFTLMDDRGHVTPYDLMGDADELRLRFIEERARTEPRFQSVLDNIRAGLSFSSREEAHDHLLGYAIAELETHFSTSELVHEGDIISSSSAPAQGGGKVIVRQFASRGGAIRTVALQR